jgi:integrase
MLTTIGRFKVSDNPSGEVFEVIDTDAGGLRCSCRDGETGSCRHADAVRSAREGRLTIAPDTPAPRRRQSAARAARAAAGTVAKQIAEFLETKRLDCAAHIIGPGALHIWRYRCPFIVQVLGEKARASEIGADSIERFYRFCLGKVVDEKWSTATAKGAFWTLRSFVRYLAEKEVIDVPRNLDSRRFRFGDGPTKIETFTNEEVRKAVAETTGTLRTALLLMCNCGMTQADVSDLLDSEVDWKEGRVTRKRSKTKKKKSTPTVSYPLWPITLDNLKACRSGKHRVLQSNAGTPLVGERVDADGVVRAHDYLEVAFRLKRGEIGLTKSLKYFRKTSATLLDTYEVTGRISTLFLGHSPSSMKDRHYSAPPQNLFDEAIRWLGREYGLAE